MPGDELRHKLEALIEAAQDVHHQGAVQDRLAKISKAVGHALHFAAEFVDGERVLAELAELGVEQHSPRFAVVEELLLEAEPRGTGRDTVAFVDDVEQVGGDGVEDPRDDDAVHARPGGVVGAGNVAEDVVFQREATEDEKKVPAPLGVVGGLQVKNDGYQIFDVL